MWTFFVDAEPMKGWEHECYKVDVPKLVLESELSNIPLKKFKLKIPPAGNFVPVSVKNRYGDKSNVKPFVVNSAQPNAEDNVAQRTYAIILSGGINYISNHERYWNDCSFIYQTLVKKYGIPKSNIYPIMSDGDNPAADMRCTTGEYKSQSVDLDFDGQKDIYLSATKQNIQSTLNKLLNKLNEDDHLFIYVIDHGGTNDYNTASYICLWNNEKLMDTELAQMLEPFSQKYVNVNVVLGQCFSGGFIDDLTKVGCVVAAASSGSEYSWACSDIPFDEFVYHWTCAVNRADHRGYAVSADMDGDGYVTMQEAFNYAKKSDRENAEHPQYISTPLSVGEDLAFNRLAPAVDLYVKDNFEDTGKAPNMTTDKFWLSPDIWVRNRDDNKTEHENPYYSVDEEHYCAIVYTRVHNRGKKAYEGGTQYVHNYWAKASTGFTHNSWQGNETYVNGEITGGPMYAVVIPRIEAGESRIVKTTWALPQDLIGSSADNDTEKHHFCLLAKILDTPSEPWHNKTFTYNPQLNSKEAQINLSIISKIDLATGTNVFVRNVKDASQKYTLELIPRTFNDEKIYNYASIIMEMSQPVFNAWERGGLKSVNVNRVPSISNRAVEFKSKDSKLEAISLEGNEFDKVSLKFNFNETVSLFKKFTIDLIQRDEKGKIIGGETFEVEAPRVINTPIIITPILKENGNTLLSVNVNQNETVRWEANDGTVISESDSVEVRPQFKSDNIYRVYMLSETGDLSTGSIKLDSNVGFEYVAFDEQKDILKILLKDNVPELASIIVSSVLTGDNIIEKEIDKEDSNLEFSVASLRSGIYTVSYLINGEVVDSVKVSK